MQDPDTPTIRLITADHRYVYFSTPTLRGILFLSALTMNPDGTPVGHFAVKLLHDEHGIMDDLQAAALDVLTSGIVYTDLDDLARRILIDLCNRLQEPVPAFETTLLPDNVDIVVDGVSTADLHP